MRARRAFTLVELLVVIAIIGVLVAILLPAIQSARESARKVTCANNMRQISLAVLQHSDANRDMLPGLWRTFRRRDGGPASGDPGNLERADSAQSFGWRSTLLPYLEEQNLFDQIDFTKSVVDGGGRLQPALLTVLPVFQCPSTPGYPRLVRGSGDSGVTFGGAYDYDISAGQIPHTTYNWRLAAFDGIPSQTLRDDGDRDTPNFVKAYGRIRQSGRHPMQTHHGPARLRWITDGLTQTTMLLEQAWQPNWVDREREIELISAALGWNWATPLRALNGGQDSSGSGSPINQTNWRGRFAFHPGGVHNVMLDGSVSFLSEETHLTVLRAIDTRDNGEVISDSDWR